MRVPTPSKHLVGPDVSVQISPSFRINTSLTDFPLDEVLVVITIIVVLIALLLSANQKIHAGTSSICCPALNGMCSPTGTDSGIAPYELSPGLIRRTRDVNFPNYFVFS